MLYNAVLTALSVFFFMLMMKIDIASFPTDHPTNHTIMFWSCSSVPKCYCHSGSLNQLLCTPKLYHIILHMLLWEINLRFFGCFKHRLVGVCCQHPEQQCVDMHFKLLIKSVMLCGKWHDTDWTTPKSIFDCDAYCSI